MAKVQTEQTVKEWLDRVASSSVCYEADSAVMQTLLRRIGFSKAVVASGIVYAEGHGTPDYPPMSVQLMAHALAGQSG